MLHTESTEWPFSEEWLVLCSCPDLIIFTLKFKLPIPTVCSEGEGRGFFFKFASHGWLHIFLPLIAKGRYMPKQTFALQNLSPRKAAPGKQVLWWIIPPAHFHLPSLWAPAATAQTEKSSLASLKQISEKLLLLLLSNFQHFILVNSAGDHSPQEGTGTWGSEDESFCSTDNVVHF